MIHRGFGYQRLVAPLVAPLVDVPEFVEIQIGFQQYLLFDNMRFSRFFNCL